RNVSISGNHAFSDSELRGQLSLKPRPIYQIWKERPVFDRDLFPNDLKRTKRFYEAHGYYRAAISYDLDINGDLIDVTIRITENEPVRVHRVTIELGRYKVPPDDPLYKHISLKPGEIFGEKEYQGGAEAIEAVFRNAAYAHVTVTRSAHVNVSRNEARVLYMVNPGVKAVFGQTQLEGEQAVAPDVILRELTYKAGEPFSQRKLDESRDRLLAMNLFAVVNFKPELESRNPSVAPIRLVVK